MLLFYAAQKSRAVDALEKVLADRLPPHRIFYCNALDILEKRLRRPRQDLTIVLMCVCDAIEMVKLSEIRGLLDDIRLLLVLPRRDDATVAWAHQFGPRFIDYADAGAPHMTAVLQKMLGAMARADVFRLEHKRLLARLR